MIGETIGHYRIIERLGAGGMGEVFLAEDLRLRRQAAIKIIAEHLTRDEARRQRFVQEARLAASIDHPNIAAIYDVDQAGDRTFIAMEYVPGPTLRHLLRESPLAPARALDLAIQIAGALAKVHERGIIHRDLKPDNVIVSLDGDAKIIDFGLAKLAEPAVEATGGFAETTAQSPPKTEEGVVLGTVPYMSPEQARGQPIDGRSDIFSFGALLYEMLTARSAFRRSTAIDTLSAVIREEPPAVTLRDVPAMPQIRRILARCLQKDAASRYQTMRDVEQDLKRVRQTLDGSAATARARVMRRLTRPILAGSAAALVLIAAAAWMLTRRGSPESGAPASAPDASRPAVALLTFDGPDRSSAQAWLSKGLPSLVGLALAASPDIEVVTRSRLDDEARTSGRDSFDVVEAKDEATVARQAGARVVVLGGILEVAGNLTIDTRGVDAATGRVLFTETVRGSDVPSIADDLAARIRSRLGLGGAVPRLADVASSSVDALRAYLDGTDALDRWRTADADRAFDRATRLDGAFALAYLRWGTADLIDGRPDAARTHVSRAIEHASRMPEREHLEAQADLALLDGRFADALTLDDSLLAAYPDTERMYLAASDLTRVPSGPVPDAAATVALLARGVGALPASGALHQALGSALLSVGRFDDAVHEFQTDIRLRPKDSGAVETLADGQLVSGDPRTAIDTYRRAVKAGSDSARVGLGWALAAVGRYDEALDADRSRGLTRAFLLSRVGRIREAEGVIQSALHQADRDGDVESGVSLVLLDALIAVESGDCLSARSRLDDATTRVGGLPDALRRRWLILDDLFAGVCEIRSGRIDAARDRVNRRRGAVLASSPNERWWLHALEAEVDLAAHDGPAAARAFDEGLPAKLPFDRLGVALALSVFGNALPFRDTGAQALAVEGKLNEAIAAYRQLMTPSRGARFTGVLDPRHVLALARLLDKAGQKDAARTEYRRFLEFWSRADPDRPELAEARKAG